MNFSYINMLRPKNLLIIGICQFVIYHFVIHQYLVSPALNIFLFSLLVVDTLLIAAAGYIINDIKDYQLDHLNKPALTYIPRLISFQKAWVYYWALVSIGALIALYVALQIRNFPLFFIYPSAVGLLYSYSAKYKSSVIIGNVLVSIFVSMVTGILFFAERQSISSSTSNVRDFVIEVLTAYMLFSFLINMIREVIKDIEDVIGDQKYEIKTTATIYGVASSKKLALITTCIAIIAVISWLIFSPIHFDFRFTVFLILFIVLPLLLIIQIIQKHTEKRDFSKISKILKTIMLMGLISIILLTSSTIL